MYCHLCFICKLCIQLCFFILVLLIRSLCVSKNFLLTYLLIYILTYSYYDMLIGTHMRCIEWCYFQ